MTFGYRSSFWAKEDNKKMLRHVIAMAGVSSSLVLCLHASAIHPEQAYADETFSTDTVKIEAVADNQDNSSEPSDANGIIGKAPAASSPASSLDDDEASGSDEAPSKRATPRKSLEPKPICLNLLNRRILG